MTPEHIKEVVERSFEQKRKELRRINRAPCECTAYPFPHRPGSGKCPDAGWCPNDRTPLENRLLGWARDDAIYEGFCPECGWSTG